MTSRADIVVRSAVVARDPILILVSIYELPSPVLEAGCSRDELTGRHQTSHGSLHHLVAPHGRLIGLIEGETEK